MEAASFNRNERLRKVALWGIVSLSVLWSLTSWTQLEDTFSRLSEVGLFAGLLLVTETLFIVGLALQVWGVGLTLWSGVKSKSVAVNAFKALMLAAIAAVGVYVVGLLTSASWGTTWSYWWIPATTFAIVSLYAAREHLNAQLAESFVDKPSVWVGFYANFAGALGTGLVLVSGIVTLLPPRAWGVLILGFVDIAATFGRCIPQYRYMRSKAGHILVRGARPDDLDGYLEAQRVSWGEEMAADRAKLSKRFEIFPHGIFIAETKGRVVGAITTIRIPRYDPDELHSWHEITNDGWCDTHCPEGGVMFGVDMSATADAPEGIHDELLTRCMHQVVRDNLTAGVLGGRMPGYHKYSSIHAPEEYLWMRRSDGKFLDPQVRMYAGVPNLKVVGVIPNYFDDPESCNNGVLLVWKNPFYNVPGHAFWAWLVVVAVRIDTLISRAKKRRRRK